MGRTRRRSLGLGVALALLLSGIGLAPGHAAPNRWDAPDWGYELTAAGVIYTSPLGTFPVEGTIDATHRRHGGGTGSLGYPTAARVADDGRYGYQVFERGVVYASPWGTHAVLGAKDAKHRSTGGGSGSLGYPLAGSVQEAARHSYQRFERGVLYSSPAGTFVTLNSSVLARMHAQSGGGSGRNGYPTADEWQHVPGQWLQPFERAYAYVESTNATIVSWCAARTCRTVPGPGNYWLGRPPEADHLLRLLNRERAAEGKPALKESPRLSAASQRWAHKMLLTGTRGHNTEELRSAENVAWGRNGTSYPVPAGWNPFRDPAANAQRMVTMWMGSPGHRANVLRWTSVGLGYTSGPDTSDPAWYRLEHYAATQFG